MQLHPSRPRAGAGYALMLVLVFMGVSSLMLAGVMDWISTRARLAARQQTWQTAAAAAESAANKALAAMIQDFLAGTEASVFSDLAKYTRQTPARNEHPFWSQVTFFDKNGATDRITVERVETWRFGALLPRYQDMAGYYATYRITAGASLDFLPSQPVAALVQYDVQLADIPVFAHQFFSAMDLEFTPGSAMNFNGRVHANGNIYAYPDGVTINFRGDVTAAGGIYTSANPDDPVARSLGTVNFRAKCDEQARHFKLPVDTAHAPAVLRALIDVPPSNEQATSPLGKQRFYNKADLIITLSSTGFRATSGRYNNFTRTIPSSIVTNIVSTNRFFDKRESRNVLAMDFNVQQFFNYSLLIHLYLGRPPQTVYLHNSLPAAPQSFNAVRLYNGETLPTRGLTVATPNPLYVRGHFNAPESFRGTSNTTQCLPAALVADAVTLLSPNWRDDQSQSPLASRRAAATTVNAAILTGIVPTGGGFYSGGAENYLRLLEDWRELNLHFNGSVVVMYPSAIAGAPWGALDDVYTPPRRQFNYDGNLLDSARQPPGTPLLRTVILARYTTLPATPSGTKK